MTKRYMPLPPNEPRFLWAEPKQQIESVHTIFTTSWHEEINIMNFLDKICKENKINLNDIFVKRADVVDINSYDNYSTGNELEIYYKTFKENKKYNSELKKYNSELKKHNIEMAAYNQKCKKYEEELERYEILCAKEVLEKAMKKKAETEREIAEAKKKLK